MNIIETNPNPFRPCARNPANFRSEPMPAT